VPVRSDSSGPETFSSCSAARVALSAAAASACTDAEAVTWDQLIDRIAWWRTAVKEISSAVTGLLPSRVAARTAAAWLPRVAAALARTRWVEVIQAQNSWMTRRGEPELGCIRARPSCILCAGSTDLPSDSGSGGVSEGTLVTHEPASVCYKAPQLATIAMCNDTISDRNCKEGR
jgi:hypothetical protein